MLLNMLSQTNKPALWRWNRVPSWPWQGVPQITQIRYVCKFLSSTENKIKSIEQQEESVT